MGREIALIADGHAQKDAFDGLKGFFSEEEIAYLTLASTMINTWNRIAICSRVEYDRGQFQRTAVAERVAEPT
jgi:alkylhydroperoxidase family enzyme